MRVPASEFARNFGRYSDEARDETIEVTSHDRVVGYFVSPKEHAALEEARSKVRTLLLAGQLSTETVERIRSSRMSEKHNTLNSLLDK